MTLCVKYLLEINNKLLSNYKKNAVTENLLQIYAYEIVLDPRCAVVNFCPTGSGENAKLSTATQDSNNN